MFSPQAPLTQSKSRKASLSKKFREQETYENVLFSHH